MAIWYKDLICMTIIAQKWEMQQTYKNKFLYTIEIKFVLLQIVVMLFIVIPMATSKKMTQKMEFKKKGGLKWYTRK